MRNRLLASAALAMLVACEPSAPRGPSYPANETYAPALGVDIATMTKIDTNLYYKDIVVGTGATAAENQIVVVTYAGYLVDGTAFAGGSGTTPPTVLSTNQFIAGWVVGIPGMKVGGKRKLVIGSNYAYGSQSRGSIPGYSTLVFDVELKSVQ
jgi:FKBP-type peptidyl-prolyl cis-trans isomerase FkpA